MRLPHAFSSGWIMILSASSTRFERETAKVFNKAGLAAFERQVRARFTGGARPDPRPIPRSGSQRSPNGIGSRFLRAIYLQQED